MPKSTRSSTILADSTSKPKSRGRSRSPRSARTNSSVHPPPSLKSRKSSSRKTGSHPKNQVFLEWLELHEAVRRDFLALRAPAAQLGQALQLACPKALKDADIAQVEFQRKVVRQTVPEHYAGYRLPWPLTDGGVQGLLRAIKTRPSVPLHDRYVAHLLLAARDLFERMPRVTEISATSGKHTKLIVVGNLHGQLADLLAIWQKHGLPHPHGPQYLFNGGLVDHGEHGVEVLLLVLAFKLLYPKSVHINRGCHEDANANRYFGFFEEVRRKCGGQRMFPLFAEVFRVLPIATLVDRAVLVVHGGLSRQPGVLLDHLRGISMSQELPNHPSSYDEELLHDLMWSRARKKTGVASKGHSHTGIEYGPDVTEAFLKANHLHYIIRSRDVPKNLKGHHTMHHRQLWSVFSASNFCGFAGNYGAVLELSADLTPTLHTHWAPPLASFGYGKVVLGLEKAVRRLKAEIRTATAADVVRQLQLRIALHRQDLYYHFSRLDGPRTGTLGVAEWAEGLTAVLKLPLPWAKYRAQLLPAAAAPGSESSVDYTAFCEAFPIAVAEPYGRWRDAIQKRIHRQLLGVNPRGIQSTRTSLASGGGLSAEEELERLLSSQALGITPRQVQEYVRGVGRPHADALKFLRAIELAQELNTQTEIYETFQILAEGLSARRHAALDVFVSHDHGCCGALGYTQFINAMHQLQSLAGVHFSDDVLRHIGMAMYSPATATVDYLQAVDVMNVARGLQEKRVVQHICNTLVRYNALFRKAFQILDYTGMGLLSVEEVMVGLLTVNTLLMASDKLSDEDIDTLAMGTDVDGNRRIPYEAFLGSFTLEGEVAHRLHSNTNVHHPTPERLPEASVDGLPEEPPTDAEGAEANQEEDADEEGEEEEEEEEEETTAPVRLSHVSGHAPGRAPGPAWDVEEPISLLSQGHISLCDAGPFNPFMSAAASAFPRPPAPAPQPVFQYPTPPVPPPPHPMAVAPVAPPGRPLPPPLPPSMLRNMEHCASNVHIPAGSQAPAAYGHGYGYPFAFVPPAPGYVPQQMVQPSSVLQEARYQQPSPVTMLDHWAEDFTHPHPQELAAATEPLPLFHQQPLVHQHQTFIAAAPGPEPVAVFRYPTVGPPPPDRREPPASPPGHSYHPGADARRQLEMTPDEASFDDPGSPISAAEEEEEADGEEEEEEEEEVVTVLSPSPAAPSSPFNPVRGLLVSPPHPPGAPVAGPPQHSAPPGAHRESPVQSRHPSPPTSADATPPGHYDPQRAALLPWPPSPAAPPSPPRPRSPGQGHCVPSPPPAGVHFDAPEVGPFAHPLITERIADPNSPPRPPAAPALYPGTPPSSGGSPQLHTERIADPSIAFFSTSPGPGPTGSSPAPAPAPPMYFHSPSRRQPPAPQTSAPPSPPQLAPDSPVPQSPGLPTTPSPPRGSPLGCLNTAIDSFPSSPLPPSPSPHPPRRSSNRSPSSPMAHHLAGPPPVSPPVSPPVTVPSPPFGHHHLGQQHPQELPATVVAPPQEEEEKVVYRIRYMTLDGEVVDEQMTEDDTFTAVPQGYNAVSAFLVQRGNDSPGLDNTSPGYSDGSGTDGGPASVPSSRRPPLPPTVPPAPAPGPAEGYESAPGCPVPPAPTSRPEVSRQYSTYPPARPPPSHRPDSEIIVCSSPAPEDWEEDGDAPPSREPRAMPAYYAQQPSPPKPISAFRYREDKTTDAVWQSHPLRSPLRPIQTEPQINQAAGPSASSASVGGSSHPAKPNALKAKPSLSAEHLVDDVMQDEQRSAGAAARGGCQPGPEPGPRINVVRNWRGEEFLLGQPDFEEDLPQPAPSPITRSALAKLDAAPGMRVPLLEDSASASTASRFTRSTTLSEHRSIVW